MDGLIVVMAKYGLVLSVVITFCVGLRLPRPQTVELLIWAVLGDAVAVALVKLGGVSARRRTLAAARVRRHALCPDSDVTVAVCVGCTAMAGWRVSSRNIH